MSTPRQPSHAAIRVFEEACARAESDSGFDAESFLAAHADVRDEVAPLLSGLARVEGLFRSWASSLRQDDTPLGEDPGAEVRKTLEHLRALRPNLARYESTEEIGHGGMGVVWRVRDRALPRDLAMKQVRTVSGPGQGEATLRLEAERLRRFLSEARITGALEHPGIVPVHDLGVDAHGRAFFTMPLLKGQSLESVLDHLARKEDEWTLPRVLAVLLKVCDTMAFAHEQGVIHRDLKPQNVMVGRFGEVYVLDWGLAKVIRGANAEARDREASASVENSGDLADAQHTHAGEVLGTPAYMAPEQANALHASVDERSDVYALGAILYHTLAGRAPYAFERARGDTKVVLNRVRTDPPVSVAYLAASAPPELVAICEKAMQRTPDQRYPSAQELGSDVRAYLEGRVVRAHQIGLVPEMNKWVRRNRALAAAIGLALMAALVGLGTYLHSERLRAQDLVRALDFPRPKKLEQAAAELWPAVPAMIPPLESWLGEARELADRRDEYRLALDAVRERASTFDPSSASERRADDEFQTFVNDVAAQLEGKIRDLEDVRRNSVGEGRDQGEIILKAEIEAWTAKLAALSSSHSAHTRDAWQFDDPTDDGLHDALSCLVRDIDAFVAPGGTIPDVERRLQQARALEAASTTEEHTRAWRAAIQSIADRTQCPAYDGLVICPQVGLLPIGRNPLSGLWEFAHLASGAVAQRGRDGAVEIEESTGIVLVLVPASTFGMGLAPGTGRSGWNNLHVHSAVQPPAASEARSEWPYHAVSLAPYFLSKYELTQGQWYRATGRTPSYFTVGQEWNSSNHQTLSVTTTRTATLLYPVEKVSWYEVTEIGRQWSLTLPTEAQYECAARAGTTGWYWDSPDDLIGCVNTETTTSDLHCLPHDGWDHPWPVDYGAPNPWGFFNVTGNVYEWTRDDFWVEFGEHQAGDGLCLRANSGLKSIRGGCYSEILWTCRVSKRNDLDPVTVRSNVGARLARPLDD